MIADNLREQFVVKLKIWNINECNERGKDQFADYPDYYHKEKGYMPSFIFNKKEE